MKTRFLITTIILVLSLGIPQAFGITEELIQGSSSFEMLPTEIIPGKPTSFEIKFQYTIGPYALVNLTPVIEVNPSSASSSIQIDVAPIEAKQAQIVRIPVTITVDPQIKHEKIFLSVSFAGEHFSSRSDAIYKSAWSDSITFDIAPKDVVGISLGDCIPVDLEFTISGGEVFTLCKSDVDNSVKVIVDANSNGTVSVDIPKTMLYALGDTECNVTNDFFVLLDKEEILLNVTPIENGNLVTVHFAKGIHEIEILGTVIMPYPSPGQYCGIVEGYEKQFLAPLDQTNRGIDPKYIRCNENLVLIQKIDDSPACVMHETKKKLIERKWAKPTPSMFRDEPSNVIIPSEILDLQLTNVVDANNQFAIDFYSQVVSDKQENVFFSPWSISTAFSIAYEGASGTTADEIRDAFGFIADDEQRRNSFSVVHDNLNRKDSQYKLHVANALWIAEGFELFSDYVDVAKTYYDSEVDTVNFEGDGAEIINEWVKNKTEEKIEDLFDPDSLGGVRLAITNAIYFNGTWVLPFDEKRTIKQDFVVNSQKTVKAPMMSRDSHYNYTSRDNLQVLDLPYLGDRLSMLILLPNDVDGIKSVEKLLSAKKISQWNNELREGRLFVQIPKFTMETDYDLIPELKELGISAAFGPADFTGISNADLFISQAIHKAFVDVNEVGTEAAAATGIAMRESMPPSFTADHPFVFIIHDKETGNILFIGKVVDPTE